jgi:hypothetical protein
VIPISVIIIGVGNKDFCEMRKLDGDDGPIKQSKGNSVYHDLV